MGSIVFIIACIAFALVRGYDTQGERCMKNVIVATGVGKHTYKPTIAEIRLGVEKLDPNAAYVQGEVSQTAQAVVSFLSSQKVSKLSTTSVSLRTNYDYKSAIRKITGYTASTSLSFQVPIEKASMILDAAVRAGATTVSSVSFRAEPAVSQNARRYAIRDAVLRARDEAHVAVVTLGRALGNPVHVKITDTFFDRPVNAPYMMRSFSEGAGGFAKSSTPIVSKEQTAHAYVTVTFSTSDNYRY